jgi:hypothetical protein
MKHTISIILALAFAVGCSQSDSERSENTQRPSGQGDSERHVERPVSPEILTRLVTKADRIVVRSGPYDDAKKLFESNDESDIVALAAALVVKKPQGYFHCMCDGTPAIYVYKGNELLVQVTNHHAQSIRCSLWDSDAQLVNQQGWLTWFDEREIKEPREEFEQMQAQRERSAKELDKWVAAMPKGLDAVWQESQGGFGQVDTSRLRKALDRSIPTKRDQILALLRWYGSGAGPWSGFPSYESAAESLLLEYEIADIVTAIELDRMSSNQLEGAARFFGGWDFSQKYPEGLQEVPKNLRAALWNHSKNTDDEDKLSRARHAFQ